MQTNCQNCGASTSTIYANCPFCNTAIRPNRVLDTHQENELLEFAKAIENRLKAAKNNQDSIVAVGCLSVVVVTAISWSVVYAMEYSTVFQIIMDTLIGGSLFVGWGFLVNMSEDKAYKAAYNDQMKGDIEHFLEQRGFYRYEFDMVASQKIGTKAILRRFLFQK